MIPYPQECGNIAALAFFSRKNVCPSLTHSDDLGRVVIPKEIRRTLHIRESDPLLMTLEKWQIFCFSIVDLDDRVGLDAYIIDKSE